MPKISGYADGGVLRAGDKLVIARSGANYYILGSAIAAGWIPDTNTWTRTGNFTFTIVGDFRTTYRKGVKVRYKDGGAYEYGVVASSSYLAPNTTVTLITNTDYTMAAAVITDNYYSLIENPEGWPGWFNYTPTVDQGVSLNIAKTVIYSKWIAQSSKIVCEIRLNMTGAGTAGSAVTVTAPIVPIYNTFLQIGSGDYSDSGVGDYGCFVQFANSTDKMRLFSAFDKNIVGVVPNIAVANNDVIFISVMYEF